MSSDQNVRNIDDDDGELPDGGRLRGARLRSREDVDKTRKDLLMHILNRTGDFQTSEDEEKDGNKVINPYGILINYYSSFVLCLSRLRSCV